MKEFAFIAWCRFGRDNSGETTVEMELSEEEADILIKYGTKADIYYNGFGRCEELKDLYRKIYDVAIKQMTEEIRDFGDDENALDPAWVVDDTYACGVNFPKEFEDLLDE